MIVVNGYYFNLEIESVKFEEVPTQTNKYEKLFNIDITFKNNSDAEDIYKFIMFQTLNKKDLYIEIVNDKGSCALDNLILTGINYNDLKFQVIEDK